MFLDPDLIREMRPQLIRVARRAVRDPVLAEDLVQEALTSALDPRTTHDGTRGSLRGYLVGILLRKVVDHHRVTTRRKTQAGFDETMDSPRDFAPFDPERTLHPIDRARALSVVEQALTTLPELQRLAIVGCDVEGLERDVVARSLEVSEGHLRVLLHRGRHVLRKALEDARMR